MKNFGAKLEISGEKCKFFSGFFSYFCALVF